jgi:hypothetical protein
METFPSWWKHDGANVSWITYHDGFRKSESKAELAP